MRARPIESALERLNEKDVSSGSSRDAASCSCSERSRWRGSPSDLPVFASLRDDGGMALDTAPGTGRGNGAEARFLINCK